MSRLDEIQARLDAADADLRAQNAWVDFTDHAHDDVAYLLERVRQLEAELDRYVPGLSWLQGWTVDEATGDEATAEGYAKAAWDVKRVLDRLGTSLTEGESK